MQYQWGVVHNTTLENTWGFYQHLCSWNKYSPCDEAAGTWMPGWCNILSQPEHLPCREKKWHISISKAEKIRDKREYAQCSPETGDPSHMTQTDTPELSTVEEKVNKKNSELDECPPDWWAPQTGQPQQWAATWPSARPRSSVSNLHFLQWCSRWSAPCSAPPPGLVQRILSPFQLMLLHILTRVWLLL